MVCGSDCGVEDSQDKNSQDLREWKGEIQSVHDLQGKLRKHFGGEIRIYTVKTTKFDKDNMLIRHEGSGPNLEGNLATLCTCKHSMRQYQTSNEWEGKWILGLTSRAKSNGFSGAHYLFYLMKVAKAFDSHKALFDHLRENNPCALKIKNATKNRLGDVFEPKSPCENPLDPLMYKTPHPNHSHRMNWYDDVIYKNKSTPLLLGEQENTFVWTKPTITFTRPRNSSSMKLTVGKDLFCFLKNA